ncbi:hypothetical protein F5146DRAFT_1001820 [Armillaria mellea]|nr:hypothetical protein F5146DRAFT_1001814 [Armillaria mellea]KAK0189569.1 hypothetical protein F5146DRAFT_1001820 [Armillaria mellea]
MTIQIVRVGIATESTRNDGTTIEIRQVKDMGAGIVTESTRNDGTTIEIRQVKDMGAGVVLINDRLEPLIRQATRLIEIEVNSGCSHADMDIKLHRQCSSLAEAMDQIERLSTKFIVLTQHSPKGYADAVYQQYQRTITADRPKGYCSDLDNAVQEISAIEQSILQHEYVILNTTGVGKEMRRLRTVLDPVHTLLGWLEEMLLEVMISPPGLKEKYNKQELAFLGC